MKKFVMFDHNQKIPAGLTDKTGEFYECNNEMHLSYNTAQFAYPNFPQEVLDMIHTDMEKHPKAIAELITNFELEDLESQTRQYLFCRHGGFDSTPDISIDGFLLPAEYVACGLRGKCASEGKLCTSIVLKFGTLTRSEINVLTEIGNGFLDKEIAEKLNISEHTIRHHKDSISKKSGLERKSALSVLACKLGLTDINI